MNSAVRVGTVVPVVQRRAALDRGLSPEVSLLRVDANLIILQWVIDEGPVSVLVPVLGYGPAMGI